MRNRHASLLLLTTLASCIHVGRRSRMAVAPLSTSLVVGTDTLVLGQPLRHPAVTRPSDGVEALRQTLPGFREIGVLRRNDTLITVVLHHDQTTTFAGASEAYRAAYGAPHETTDNMIAWCTATVRLQVVDWAAPAGPADVTAVLSQGWDRLCAAAGLTCRCSRRAIYRCSLRSQSLNRPQLSLGAREPPRSEHDGSSGRRCVPAAYPIPSSPTSPSMVGHLVSASPWSFSSSSSWRPELVRGSSFR